jgi:NTP pyrophosphatase (non-canonical NTP hydrolase)
MGQYKNEGDAALTLAEECAEVIQIITKLHRFNGNWNEIPPGKDKTRWEQLKDEMEDVLFQWNRLKEQYDDIHDVPEPLDESYKSE